MNNSSKGNKILVFKFIEGLHFAKGFLSSEDRNLCEKLSDEVCKVESEPSDEQSVETSPHPPEVSGAKKLLESLSSGGIKSTSDSTTLFSVRSLLDHEFWSAESLSDLLIAACVESEGFEPLHAKNCEELPTVFVPGASTDKTFNMSNVSNRCVLGCLYGCFYIHT